MTTRVSIFLTAWLLVATGAPTLAAGGEEWLPWTGTNRKTIRARFVSLENDRVTLELEGGKQAVVPLDRLDRASQKQAREALLRKADQPIQGIRGMKFVKVPRGRFRMGSPADEEGRVTNGSAGNAAVAFPFVQPAAANPTEPSDFETERRVDISRDFWMKETEVTWNEWNAVLENAEGQQYFDLIGKGRNGYDGDASGNHPVTGVSWFDAVKWCNLKSQIEGRAPVYHSTTDFSGAAVFKAGEEPPHANWDADGYRLPTEAEWEYACREGRSTGSKPCYADLDSIAWHATNSGGNTHPVGSRSVVAHHFGLHDMLGNVAEWCWDWSGTLKQEKVKDPKGPRDGLFRVFRGGSWADPERCCRAAYRGPFSPVAPESCLVGFRPVCGMDPAPKPKNR
ncbi:MAG: SUMF1/EgtB/PvdO family nonheme iron enzyme [Akkermansiaceae bacterium]|nr:SUMF1/EgtB/PvdO family nonheme iron enzyme [Akkermansiaceae bacterium]